MANNLKLEYLIGHSDLSGQMGGQSGAAVPHPQGNVQDVGSNPAATRKGNRTLGDPHRRWPSGPAGSEWKTSDVKAELDL